MRSGLIMNIGNSLMIMLNYCLKCHPKGPSKGLYGGCGWNMGLSIMKNLDELGNTLEGMVVRGGRWGFQKTDTIDGGSNCIKTESSLIFWEDVSAVIPLRRIASSRTIYLIPTEDLSLLVIVAYSNLSLMAVGLARYVKPHIETEPPIVAINVGMTYFARVATK